MNYWIWFATVEGISPTKKKSLLDYYKTPERIYFSNQEDLLDVNGITDDNVQKIMDSKNEELIKKYETYIVKNKIKVINIIDKEYPEKLRQIYDPPISLFCIGNISLLNKISIGIVGSREPSCYGLSVAKDFAYKLSEKGIVVVSGMARGIDAMRTCWSSKLHW